MPPALAGGFFTLVPPEAHWSHSVEITWISEKGTPYVKVSKRLDSVRQSWVQIQALPLTSYVTFALGFSIVSLSGVNSHPTSEVMVRMK